MSHDSITDAEIWEIMEDEVASTRFNRYITGYKKVTIKVPRNSFPSMHRHIQTTTNCNKPHIMDSTHGWYYLICPEIIQAFRHSKTIKINNKQIGDEFDDIAQSTIDKLIFKMKIKSELLTQEKIEEMIKKSIVEKIRGDVDYYNDEDAQYLATKHQPIDDNTTYTNDMLIGFPHQGRLLRIIFSCNNIDIISGDVNGDSCLLATVWKWKQPRIVQELIQHQLFDVDFEKKLKKNCKEYDKLYKEESRYRKKLTRLLRQLLSGEIEDNFDENIPTMFHGILHEARAKASLLNGKKSKFGLIENPCTICGRWSDVKASDRKEKPVWIWCKKHGHAHWACSAYASCCCPHC